MVAVLPYQCSSNVVLGEGPKGKGKISESVAAISVMISDYGCPPLHQMVR